MHETLRSLICLLFVLCTVSNASGQEPGDGPKGRVRTNTKISSTTSFLDTLDELDAFGAATVSLGDLNGDGFEDLAVGASLDDQSINDGCVWIFFLDGNAGLLGYRKIENPSPLPAGDQFGESLAVLGDLDGNGCPELAVGAPNAGNSTFNPGALWILFLEPDGDVSATQQIGHGIGGFPLIGRHSDQFGKLAALGDLDGDGTPDLAVGAPRRDVGSSPDFGAVWILFLNPDGTVKACQEIGPGTGGFSGTLLLGDEFGHELASLGDLDGDGVADLAVSAVGDRDAGIASGAVWILFLRADGTVRAEQKISGTSGGLVGPLDSGDQFGYGLDALRDLDGDGRRELAVGAPFDDDGGIQIGAVYILFLEPDGTVKNEQKIGAQSGGFAGQLDTNDWFGFGVSALSGAIPGSQGDLVVGAIYDDDVRTDHGAVWLVWLDPDGSVSPGSERKISEASPGFLGNLEDGDEFGSSLASLGDLDGDGIADLAAGVPLDDEASFEQGAVWIHFLERDGSTRGWTKIARGMGGFTGELAGRLHFGAAVARLGDLDGDGRTELAVGAPLDDAGGTDRGALWVLFLEADGTVRAQRKISSTSGGFAGTLRNGDQFGSALAWLGDLDGDGLGELAVGAPYDDDGGPDRGALWILELDATGRVQDQRKISATQGGFLGALANGDRFASALTLLGDLDGDGTTDLAAGAPQDDGDGNDRGAVWILFLTPAGGVAREQEIDSRSPGLRGSLRNGAHLGAALAPLGDLDGDGLPELAVGVPDDDGAFLDQGSVRILFLDEGGAPRAARRIAESAPQVPSTLFSRDRFGAALTSLPDLDGDGQPELGVGAPGDDDGGGTSMTRGAVWVLFLDAGTSGFDPLRPVPLD